MAFDHPVDARGARRPRPKDAGRADQKREVERVAETIGKKQLGHAEASIRFGDAKNATAEELGADDHVVVQMDAAFRRASAP